MSCSAQEEEDNEEEAAGLRKYTTPAPGTLEDEGVECDTGWVAAECILVIVVLLCHNRRFITCVKNQAVRLRKPTCNLFRLNNTAKFKKAHKTKLKQPF